MTPPSGDIRGTSPSGTTVGAPSNDPRFVRWPLPLNSQGLGHLVTLGFFSSTDDLTQLYAAPEGGGQFHYYGFPEDVETLQHILDTLDTLEPTAQPVPEQNFLLIPLSSNATDGVIVPGNFFRVTRAFVREHARSLALPECTPDNRYNYLPLFSQGGTGAPVRETNRDIIIPGDHISSFTPPLGSEPLFLEGPRGAQSQYLRMVSQYPESLLCRTPLTVTLDDFTQQRGFAPQETPTGLAVGYEFQAPYTFAMGMDLLHSSCQADPYPGYRLQVSLTREEAEALAAIGLLAPGTGLCSYGEDSTRPGHSLYGIPRLLSEEQKALILANLRRFVENEGIQDGDGNTITLASGITLSQGTAEQLIAQLDRGISPLDDEDSWSWVGKLGAGLGTVVLLLIAFKWGPAASDALAHLFRFSPLHRERLRDLIDWNGRESLELGREARTRLQQGTPQRTPTERRLPIFEINQPLRITTPSSEEELSLEEIQRRATPRTRAEGGDPAMMGRQGTLDDRNGRWTNRVPVPSWLRPNLAPRAVVPRPMNVRQLGYTLGDGREVRLALYDGQRYPTFVYQQGHGDPTELVYQGRSGSYALFHNPQNPQERVLVGPSELGTAPEIIIPTPEATVPLVAPETADHRFGPRRQKSLVIAGQHLDGHYQLRFAEGPNHHPTGLDLVRETGRTHHYQFQGYLPTIRQRNYWGRVGIYTSATDAGAPPLYLAFSREGEGRTPLVTTNAETFDAGRAPWRGGRFQAAPGEALADLTDFETWEREGVIRGIEDLRERQRDLQQERERAATQLWGREVPVARPPEANPIDRQAPIEELRAQLLEEEDRARELEISWLKSSPSATDPLARTLGIDPRALNVSLRLEAAHRAAAISLWGRYERTLGSERDLPPSLRFVLPADPTPDSLTALYQRRWDLMERVALETDHPDITRRLEEARIAELNWLTALPSSRTPDLWNGPEAGIFLRPLQDSGETLPALHERRVALEREWHRARGLTGDPDPRLLQLPSEGRPDPSVLPPAQDLPPLRGTVTAEDFRIDAQEYRFLSEYGFDVTLAALEGRLDPVIGREHEMDAMIEILGGRTKNSAAVTGHPGVGKSAGEEGLALRIVEGRVPQNLRRTHVVRLDLVAMVAGTTLRGEFEERLRGYIEDVRRFNSTHEHERIVTSIDEGHMLRGAGDAEGAMDASNILKPALARGEFPTILMTTREEYDRYIAKDGALARRFRPVHFAEPSPQEALAMLQGRRRLFEDHYHIRITDEALETAVFASRALMPDRYLPDKAFDLIEAAAARASVEIETEPRELARLRDSSPFLLDNGEARTRLERLSQLWSGMREDVARLRQLQYELYRLEADIRAQVPLLLQSSADGGFQLLRDQAERAVAMRAEIARLESSLSAREVTDGISWPRSTIGPEEMIRIAAERTGRDPEEIRRTVERAVAFSRLPEGSEERYRFEAHEARRVRLEAEFRADWARTHKMGHPTPEEVLAHIEAGTQADIQLPAEGEAWEERLQAEREALREAQLRTVWEPKLRQQRLNHATWLHEASQSLRAPGDRSSWDRGTNAIIWEKPIIPEPGESLEQMHTRLQREHEASQIRFQQERTVLKNEISRMTQGLGALLDLRGARVEAGEVQPAPGEDLRELHHRLTAQTRLITDPQTSEGFRNRPVPADLVLQSMEALSRGAGPTQTLWEAMRTPLATGHADGRPLHTLGDLQAALTHEGVPAEPLLRVMTEFAHRSYTPEELALLTTHAAVTHRAGEQGITAEPLEAFHGRMEDHLERVSQPRDGDGNGVRDLRTARHIREVRGVRTVRGPERTRDRDGRESEHRESPLRGRGH